MTNDTTSKLAAKVAAQNAANAEANRLQPLFIEALRPFVGRKVLIRGGIAKAVKAKLPATNNTPSLRVWREPSNYTLRWSVSASRPVGDHGCCYAEASFYVGDVEGYDLTKLVEPATRRTDYTVEEIIEKRKALDVADQAKRDAESALAPFGRYDQ